jgi:predicted nuclease with RNAse H fold
MRTLGIDLAAQAKRTAVCVIEWDDGTPKVSRPVLGRTDVDLLALMSEVDAVGIDAPFGWPEPFTKQLGAYAASGAWPAPENTRELLYRATDAAVRGHFIERQPSLKLNPLSVSSDRIAVCAWRCAGLLHEHARGRAFDRIGEQNSVFEVYPAASLASWGLDYKGYKPGNAEKSQRAKEMRDRIAGELPWVDEDLRAHFVESDDKLDAFVASLTARAAWKGRTVRPENGKQHDLAAIEGWIHIPEADSLRNLDVIS